MSIKPTYSAQLLQGSKKVEFRKSKLRPSVRLVAIYESSPTQRVVGFFRVDSVVEGTPAELWDRYRSIGGIDQASFDKYFEDTEKGVAILVADATRLAEPLKLEDFQIRTAPQSFIYLQQEFGDFLESKSSENSPSK